MDYEKALHPMNIGLKEYRKNYFFHNQNILFATVFQKNLSRQIDNISQALKDKPFQSPHLKNQLSARLKFEKALAVKFGLKP